MVVTAIRLGPYRCHNHPACPPLPPRYVRQGLEKRQFSEAAKSRGAARSRTCELPGRYRAEGEAEAAFEPRHRPKTSPRRQPRHSPGTAHAITRLRKDLRTRAVNAATGKPIRELTLNPAKTYQPTGRPPGWPPGWPKKTPRPLRRFAASSMPCDITARRAWDSNPRARSPLLAVFKTAAIGH
jgi:hypothetical protein